MSALSEAAKKRMIQDPANRLQNGRKILKNARRPRVIDPTISNNPNYHPGDDSGALKRIKLK